jgi:hypothetical protein
MANIAKGQGVAEIVAHLITLGGLQPA